MKLYFTLSGLGNDFESYHKWMNEVMRSLLKDGVVAEIVAPWANGVRSGAQLAQHVSKNVHSYANKRGLAQLMQRSFMNGVYGLFRLLGRIPFLKRIVENQIDFFFGGTSPSTQRNIFRTGVGYSKEGKVRRREDFHGSLSYEQRGEIAKYTFVMPFDPYAEASDIREKETIFRLCTGPFQQYGIREIRRFEQVLSTQTPPRRQKMNRLDLIYRMLGITTESGNVSLEGYPETAKVAKQKLGQLGYLSKEGNQIAPRRSMPKRTLHPWVQEIIFRVTPMLLFHLGILGAVSSGMLLGVFGVAFLYAHKGKGWSAQQWIVAGVMTTIISFVYFSTSFGIAALDQPVLGGLVAYVLSSTIHSVNNWMAKRLPETIWPTLSLGIPGWSRRLRKRVDKASQTGGIAKANQVLLQELRSLHERNPKTLSTQSKKTILTAISKTYAKHQLSPRMQLWQKALQDEMPLAALFEQLTLLDTLLQKDPNEHWPIRLDELRSWQSLLGFDEVTVEGNPESPRVINGRFHYDREHYANTNISGKVMVYKDENGKSVYIKTISHIRYFFVLLKEYLWLSDLGYSVKMPKILGAGIYTNEKTGAEVIYLALDDVRGSTLGEVARSEKLSLAQTVQLTRSLLKQYGQLHTNQALHIDTNPSNVMIPLRTDGKREVFDYSNPVLVDFGFAMALPKNGIVQLAHWVGRVIWQQQINVEKGQYTVRAELANLGKLIKSVNMETSQTVEKLEFNDFLINLSHMKYQSAEEALSVMNDFLPDALKMSESQTAMLSKQEAIEMGETIADAFMTERGLIKKAQIKSLIALLQHPSYEVISRARHLLERVIADETMQAKIQPKQLQAIRQGLAEQPYLGRINVSTQPGRMTQLNYLLTHHPAFAERLRQKKNAVIDYVGVGGPLPYTLTEMAQSIHEVYPETKIIGTDILIPHWSIIDSKTGEFAYYNQSGKLIGAFTSSGGGLTRDRELDAFAGLFEDVRNSTLSDRYYAVEKPFEQFAKEHQAEVRKVSFGKGVQADIKICMNVLYMYPRRRTQIILEMAEDLNEGGLLLTGEEEDGIIFATVYQKQLGKLVPTISVQVRDNSVYELPAFNQSIDEAESQTQRLVAAYVFSDLGRWPFLVDFYERVEKRVTQAWGRIAGKLMGQVLVPGVLESGLFVGMFTLVAHLLLSLVAGLPMTVGPPFWVLFSIFQLVWHGLHLPSNKGGLTTQQFLKAWVQSAFSPARVSISGITGLVMLGVQIVLNPAGLTYAALFLTILLSVHIVVNAREAMHRYWRRGSTRMRVGVRRAVFKWLYGDRPLNIYADFNETISRPRTHRTLSLRDIVSKDILDEKVKARFVKQYNQSRGEFSNAQTQELYREYYRSMTGVMTLKHIQERGRRWKMNENFLNRIQDIQTATGVREINLHVVSRSSEQALRHFFQLPSVKKQLDGIAVRVTSVKANRLIFDTKGVFTGEVMEDFSQSMIADNKYEFVPRGAMYFGDEKEYEYGYKHFIDVNNGYHAIAIRQWMMSTIRKRLLSPLTMAWAWLIRVGNMEIHLRSGYAADYHQSPAYLNIVKMLKTVPGEERRAVVKDLEEIFQSHQVTLEDLRTQSEVNNSWSEAIAVKARAVAWKINIEVTNLESNLLKDVPEPIRQAFWDWVLIRLFAQHDDGYTFGHSWTVGNLAAEMAAVYGQANLKKDLNAATIEIFRRGGWVHDAGKLMVPPALLLKTGKLTQKEKMLIRTHARLGESVLDAFGYPAEIIQATNHHEWLNGKGYPRGLHKESVPALSRAISVADAYNAATERFYNQDKAIAIFEEFFELSTKIVSRYDAHWVKALQKVKQRMTENDGLDLFKYNEIAEDEQDSGGWLRVSPLKTLGQMLGTGILGMLMGFWLLQDPALSTLTVFGSISGLSIAAIHAHRFLMRRQINRSTLTPLTKEALNLRHGQVMALLRAQGDLPKGFNPAAVRLEVLAVPEKVSWWQRLSLGQGDRQGDEIIVRLHPQLHVLSIQEMATVVRHEIWEAYTQSHLRASLSEIVMQWFGKKQVAMTSARSNEKATVLNNETPKGQRLDKMPDVVTELQQLKQWGIRPNEALGQSRSLIQRWGRQVLSGFVFARPFVQSSHTIIRTIIGKSSAVLGWGFMFVRTFVQWGLGLSQNDLAIDASHPALQALLLENGLPDQTTWRMAGKHRLSLPKIIITPITKTSQAELRGQRAKRLGLLQRHDGQQKLYLPNGMLASYLKGLPTNEQRGWQATWNRLTYRINHYLLGLLIQEHAAAYQENNRIDLIVSALQVQSQVTQKQAELNLPAMRKTLAMSGWLPAFVSSPIHRYWQMKNTEHYLRYVLQGDHSMLSDQLQDTQTRLGQSLQLYLKAPTTATEQAFIKMVVRSMQDTQRRLPQTETMASLRTLSRLATKMPNMKARTVGYWVDGLQSVKLPGWINLSANARIKAILKDILTPLPIQLDQKFFAPEKQRIRRTLQNAA